MSDFLKGNFKVKRPIKEEDETEAKKTESEKLQEEMREKALASLGGSMVYVERTSLTWSGDKDENDGN